MPQVFWVALGGAIGSSLRYGVNVWGARTWGTMFPWHTLIVNVVGCFAMGLLSSLFVGRLQVSQEARLFLTTGILGGFTTFSAFALDAATLVERRAIALAVIYVLASVAGSLLGVFAGRSVA